MNILMTGGTGLIGQAFIRQFDDHQFTVLSRSKPNKANASSALPATVNLIDSLDRLHNLDDFDAVINLAGEPIIDKRWSPKQKHIICQSRWLLTQQLVDLFANSQTPPSVFLNGSAIGAYGDRGDQIVTEASPVEVTDFPTKLCLKWEEIAMGAAPYTRVVLLRTGIVLAAHGGALGKMLLPFKCCLGGRIGDGRQFMSWIHYQDHLNAMQFALLESSISGAVNLVAPEAQRNSVFTQALAKSLNRVAVVPLPKKILQLLLGESSCLLLDSQRIAPQKLLQNGFEFKFQSVKLAFDNLLRSPSV
tara:strand:+ start:4497 stop:5408 length:912 start_codon:yes stop_codon:yes gene_type:complete